MLVAGQPVAAAAQWFSPPQPFDDSPAVDSSATMATDGTVVVARVIPRGPIEVRVRPPGGSFGPAVSLTPSGDTQPQLVAGPNGYIAAAWSAGSDEYVAVRPPGGSFSKPRVLVFGYEVPRQHVAVDGTGRVWLVSNSYDPARVVTLGPDGSVRAIDLSAGRDWQHVDVAALGVDAAGVLTVLYTRSRSTWGSNDGDPCSSASQVRVAEGDPVDITDVGLLAEATSTGVYHLGQCTHETGTDAYAASLAVHPSGAAVATYVLGTVNDGGPVQRQTVARMHPAGGAWQWEATPAEPIGPSWVWPSRIGSTPVFAGETPIVMLDDSDAGMVQLVTRGAGGWSAPQTVAPNLGWQPLVAGSPSGTATVAYIDGNSSPARAMAVVRAADGTLSTPVPLSATQDPAQRTAGIGMDDDGDAVAVWTEGSWSDGPPLLAGYDAIGPRLGGFPTGGEAGEPVTFSASATDMWSGVASVGWSFGDGTSATGDTVTHIFGLPGTFTVSVTAVDRAGNASTRAAPVSIVDSTPPVFSRTPSVMPKRLRRGRTAIVFFGSGEPVTVQAQLLATRRGFLSGRRCLARSRRHRRRALRRCRRTVRLTTRTTHLPEGGVGNIAIATKRLRPGRYTIVVDAMDPAGNHSDPVTLTLTVLPRKRR